MKKYISIFLSVCAAVLYGCTDMEDALTEMEDSLLAAGSGPKRKKPSFFRRLFGLR